MAHMRGDGKTTIIKSCASLSQSLSDIKLYVGHHCMNKQCTKPFSGRIFATKKTLKR